MEFDDIAKSYSKEFAIRLFDNYLDWSQSDLVAELISRMLPAELQEKYEQHKIDWEDEE
jgi:hypothetical protein